jgi:hypothetical protein
MKELKTLKTKGRIFQNPDIVGFTESIEKLKNLKYLSFDYDYELEKNL